ncbi:MAG TPA: hypothetical protein VMF91_18455 [Bryobacteraceae bacterium]|nr:hypothetical protein [Bryobacteraceae bacterium]
MNLHESKLFPVKAGCGKAIFSAAGDAEFAQATIYKCAEAIRSADPSSIGGQADLARVISHALDLEYRRLVFRRPDRHPSYHFQLLFAVWSPRDGAALYSTRETSVKPCTEYVCLGAGLYLGHYLLRPMYQTGMSLRDIALPATYAIAKAKEYVEGCGGHTNFMVLKSDGRIGDVSWHITEPVERALKEYEATTKALLFSLADSSAGFAAAMETFSAKMDDLRTTVGANLQDDSGLIRRWRSLFENPDER